MVKQKSKSEIWNFVRIFLSSAKLNFISYLIFFQENCRFIFAKQFLNLEERVKLVTFEKDEPISKEPIRRILSLRTSQQQNRVAIIEIRDAKDHAHTMSLHTLHRYTFRHIRILCTHYHHHQSITKRLLILLFCLFHNSITWTSKLLTDQPSGLSVVF